MRRVVEYAWSRHPDWSRVADTPFAPPLTAPQVIAPVGVNDARAVVPWPAVTVAAFGDTDALADTGVGVTNTSAAAISAPAQRGTRHFTDCMLA